MQPGGVARGAVPSSPFSPLRAAGGPPLVGYEFICIRCRRVHIYFYQNDANPEVRAGRGSEEGGSPPFLLVLPEKSYSV